MTFSKIKKWKNVTGMLGKMRAFKRTFLSATMATWNGEPSHPIES